MAAEKKGRVRYALGNILLTKKNPHLSDKLKSEKVKIILEKKNYLGKFL